MIFIFVALIKKECEEFQLISTHKAKSSKSVDRSSGSVLITMISEEKLFIWEFKKCCFDVPTLELLEVILLFTNLHDVFKSKYSTQVIFHKRVAVAADCGIASPQHRDVRLRRLHPRQGQHGGEAGRVAWSHHKHNKKPHHKHHFGVVALNFLSCVIPQVRK